MKDLSVFIFFAICEGMVQFLDAVKIMSTAGQDTERCRLIVLEHHCSTPNFKQAPPVNIRPSVNRFAQTTEARKCVPKRNDSDTQVVSQSIRLTDTNGLNQA